MAEINSVDFSRTAILLTPGQLTSTLRLFFAWWLGELVGLIPESLQRAVRPHLRLLILDLSEREVVLRQCMGETCSELGRVDVSAMDAPAANRLVRRLLETAPRPRQETALRLPGSVALRTSLKLPTIAESELREVLRHQIDRHTPFSAEETYFDYKITGRDPVARRFDVELTVVPRGVVDDHLRRAAAWGVNPAIVDVANGGEPTRTSLNLLGGEGLRNPDRRWARVNAALSFVALGLFIAAVYVPLDQRRTLANDLRSLLAQARTESGDVLKIQEQSEALLAEARFLAEKRWKAPLAISVIEELSSLLPDDTWVYHLDISRPQVRVSGYSPSASSMIEIIDRSPMFGGPKFRSPVTRPEGNERERFDLSFELKSTSVPR